MFTDAVIMAGGSGTRLWPASDSVRPKQFLALPGGSTFFSAALERAFAVLPPAGDGLVVVVAGRSHAAHVLRACGGLPPDKRERVVLVPEPAARNTAPAVACACVLLARIRGPGRTALVLTSDHVIEPLSAFASDAAAAAALAREGKLVVFGIPPSRPETGFGYVEAADGLQSRNAPGRAFRVAAFREKPDRATAEAFLATGRFYWNSGMFGFSADAMLDEFRRSAPEVSAPFEALAAPDGAAWEKEEGVRVLALWKGLENAYRETRAISIDYAVAEKAEEVAVVAASFGWTDVGSWDEYSRLLGDEAGKPAAESGSRNCWVDADLPVALCGVEDLIVVARAASGERPARVLVCRKGQTQRVKDVAEAFKAQGRSELL